MNRRQHRVRAPRRARPEKIAMRASGGAHRLRLAGAGVGLLPITVLSATRARRSSADTSGSIPRLDTVVKKLEQVLVERCCQAWQLAQGGCDAMQ